VAQVKTEYVKMAEDHAQRQSDKEVLTYAQALENGAKLNFTDNNITKPHFTGTKEIEVSLNELRSTIDWTPFLQTWELRGQYPAILQDEVVGAEATKLFADANAMLDTFISNKSLTAKGVIFIYPANSIGDDVEVYTDESRHTPLNVFHFLRQQRKLATGIPNLCLADYIAPKDSGIADYMGGFAVTAGLGLDKIVAAYEADHDDYNSIMAKAIADRLAESFAEYLHRAVRTEYWGYAPDEALDNEDLIRENYAGIRPAPGYPACPDHTEKRLLFDLIKPEAFGLTLTESMAMWPAAAVSGFYFAHPQSKYFGLGKINKDQVENYAHRKGMSVAEVERWLSPVLNY